MGTHPRDLITALPEPRALDRAKLADLIALHDKPDTTVFAGVRRLPLGHLLRLAPGGRPVVERWFRPDTEQDRSIRVADAPTLMRETVRGAVAASLPASGPVAATLSGGLDSSTVVATAASLLRGTDRRIAAFTHVPLPGTPDISGTWLASDAPYARATAAHVGGVDLTEIANTERVLPLEATDAAIRTTWQPVFNPHNQVWIGGIVAGAEAAGSPVLLTGAAGNYSFSRNRLGILRSLARSGRWLALARQARARRAAGLPWPRSIRSVLREAAPDPAVRLLYKLRGYDPDEGGYGYRDLPYRDELISDAARAELVQMGREYTPDREEYVAAVLMDFARITFGQSLSERVWWSDPLSDPEVVSLALRLPEEAWLYGGQDRGLAREVARGLVPDEVRLRTTYGAQAADVGLVTAGHEDAYRALLERMRASATAAEVIDLDRLDASLGAPFADLANCHEWQGVFGRAFGVGQFICWYEDEVLAG